MAKRRVNTKLLVILTAAVVGVGGGVIAYKKFHHESPEKYVALGDNMMQMGSYEKAAQDYGLAFGYGGQHDLGLLMKQAEAWEKLSETDPVYQGRMLACWQRALEVDQKYEPALRKMLEAWEQESKVNVRERQAKAYPNVRDYAERLSKVVPQDKGIAAKIPASVVQAWLVGVATEPKVVEDAIAALSKLQLEDPANAEIPTVLAKAQIQRAIDAAQRGDVAGQDRAIKQAEAVFETSLKGQEQNTRMHVRASQIYMFLSSLRPKGDERTRYGDLAKAEAGRVLALAKPANEEDFDDILGAAGVLLQTGDPAAAGAAMKSVVDARPDDDNARTAYATILSQAGDSASRTKAIELLSKPISAKGVSPARQREADSNRLYLLTSLRIDQLREPTLEGSARDTVMKTIEADLGKLKPVLGENNPKYLRQLGTFELYRGHTTEATQALARVMQQQQGRGDGQLMLSLAQAYLSTNQTGEAKKLLGKILASAPGYVPARKVMAQIALQENDADAADVQVSQLEKDLPNDPEVKRQRIAVLMLRKQPEAAKKVYEGLPEGDRASRIGKGRIALGIGDNAEAIRLLEPVFREDPKNAAIVRLLVAAHRGRNDLTSARAVVDAAVAANPTDFGLAAMRKQLSGATGEEMAQFTREAVEKTADPFTREMQLAVISGEEGKAAEALDHLKKAEQIKPEDPRVLEGLFNVYLRDAKWELAAQYGEKLGKLDADKSGGALYKFRLLVAQEKFPEALAVAEDLSGKMPEFAQTWVTLGQARQANNQLDAAVQAFQRALDKKTDNADALRGLIDCAYRQGRPEEAQRYITQARRTFPATPYFRELELQHMLRYGDPDDAVAQFEDARKQNPESRANWANLSQAYWRALSAKRVANDQAGATKYEQALTTLAAEGVAKWPDEQIFYGYQAELAALHGDLNAGVEAIKRLGERPLWKGKPDVSMILADYYLRFGKMPEAEAAAREAVSATAAMVNGDDTAARVKLAAIQVAAGNVDEGIKTLEPRADDPRVARQKLQFLVMSKRLDSAEKLALQLLEKEPKATDLINALVAIYLESGQFDQALARVNQVLTTEPGNAQALYGRGLTYLRRPKPDVDAAIADLKAARDKNEANTEARYWLAEALVAKNDYDGAIRELDAAVRQVPGNKMLRLRMAAICSSATPPRWSDAERVLREGRALPQFAADVDLAVAETRMWIARRQGDKAVEVAQKAIGATRGNPEVTRAYMDALLAAGEYQRLINETDKAIALKGDTTEWWVFQDRGVAHRRLGKKDEALAEFERALNHNEVRQRDDLQTTVLNTVAEEMGIDEAIARVAPKAEGNVQWQMLLSSLYQQKHDSASAIATIEKVLANLDKVTPQQRVSVLRFAGSLYLTAEPKPMPEKAVAVFERSLKESPDDVGVLNNMASVLTDYLDTPRPQEALKYSQRAYDLMRQSGRVEPLVLDTHGRVLTMVNRVGEGIVLLQEAVDRTSIPEVHYHLAEAYMQQNAPAEAQKHLVRAQAAIERAKKDKQSVDPKMVKRIEELAAQAKQMTGTKAQAKAQ